MKKLLASLFAIAFVSLTAQAAVFTTNIVVGTPTAYLLSTNGMDVYNIQIVSDKATTVELFDSISAAAPFSVTNSTNAAYVTRQSIATNYVTTYVNNTGYTNWYTNSGRWTYTVTNGPSTNALTPLRVIATSANVATSLDVNDSFIRGVGVRSTTNVTLILYYNPR